LKYQILQKRKTKYHSKKITETERKYQIVEIDKSKIKVQILILQPQAQNMIFILHLLIGQTTHVWCFENGYKVKLQRNTLSVLEHPTGNELDDDNDLDTNSGSDISEHDFYRGSEFYKISKSRVRPTRLWYHVKVIQIKHKRRLEFSIICLLWVLKLT